MLLNDAGAAQILAGDGLKQAQLFTAASQCHAGSVSNTNTSWIRLLAKKARSEVAKLFGCFWLLS